MASLVIRLPKDKLDWPVAELELSVSAYKALRKKGLETIRDLLAFVERKNWAKEKYPLGVTRSKEIAKKLGEWNLADTEELLQKAGYDMWYYEREPLNLSLMALNLPRGNRTEGTSS